MADLIKENIKLHQNVSKLQQTIADQQQILEHLEKEIVDHKRNNTLQQQRMDSRMNQSFGAYQLMLQDIEDKHNQHVSAYNNQSFAPNQSVADLAKQIHFLSLSLLDTEKKYAAINAKLTGKYGLISLKWPQICKACLDLRIYENMNAVSVD